MVAGSGLVVAGVCWCRKVDTGSGLVVAGANWWLLVQESGRWCPLVQEGNHWCKKAVVGAGLAAAGVELVAASAGKWPPVQEW